MPPLAPKPYLTAAGDPDQIKTQLGEVLDLQDEGKNNMTIKLKKKALQGAQTELHEVCWKLVPLTSPAAQHLLTAAAVHTTSVCCSAD